MAEATKINYEIPVLPLTLGKKMKPKTPISHMFMDALDTNNEKRAGQLTVQKPFNFETSKRLRLE